MLSGIKYSSCSAKPLLIWAWFSVRGMWKQHWTNLQPGKWKEVACRQSSRVLHPWCADPLGSMNSWRHLQKLRQRCPWVFSWERTHSFHQILGEIWRDRGIPIGGGHGWEIHILQHSRSSVPFLFEVPWDELFCLLWSMLYPSPETEASGP